MKKHYSILILLWLAGPGRSAATTNSTSALPPVSKARAADMLTIDSAGPTNYTTSTITLSNLAGSYLLAKTNGEGSTVTIHDRLTLNTANLYQSGTNHPANKSHNFAIIGGSGNWIGAPSDGVAIFGGRNNLAHGDSSVILGGRANTNRGDYDTVIAGGSSNTIANIARGSIWGGVINHVDGENNAVIGGWGNRARDHEDGIIAGGRFNILSRGHPTPGLGQGAILGGVSNNIATNNAMIVGNYVTNAEPFQVKLGYGGQTLNIHRNGNVDWFGVGTGNGRGLTNLSAANVAGNGGLITNLRTPLYITNASGTSAVILSRANTGLRYNASAAQFKFDDEVVFEAAPIGDGSRLTNLNASGLRSGTIDPRQVAPTNAVTPGFPMHLAFRNGTNVWITDPKVYRALVSQTGNSAPVATVLENSLGGSLVWSYVSSGRYLGMLKGAFPRSKVWINFDGNATSDGTANGVFIRCYRNNDDSVAIIGNRGNNQLVELPLEILVYP